MESSDNNPRNHRQRWSEEDDLKLSRCAARYLSVQQTAVELERTIGAVIHRANELGVNFSTSIGLRRRL